MKRNNHFFRRILGLVCAVGIVGSFVLSCSAKVVSFNNVPSEAGYTHFVAMYSENGKLLKLKKATSDVKDQALSFTTEEQYATIKLIILDGNNKPVCAAKLPGMSIVLGENELPMY